TAANALTSSMQSVARRTGDQVLLGEAVGGEEPPVLYYNHSDPSVRLLADDFTAWLEALPDALQD
ncbi:MAG: SMI1/KNR4 family protein, partial [Myxococcales bacterium]|nr:SMI1/KNR4 family protein [Myxococcales bacterium]